MHPLVQHRFAIVDVISLTKWGVELTGKFFGAWSTNRRPLHRQSARLLSAFVAHGVLPHQLARFVPASFNLAPGDLATPRSLALKIGPDLVDWAAQALSLRREWLELEDDTPHCLVRWYKQPERLYEWMAERTKEFPGRLATLHLVSEHDCSDPSRAQGRFFLVFEQAFAELGDKVLSRHWLLSEGLHFEHPPCVVDLIAALVIAEHLSVFSVAHIAGPKIIAAAEQGQLTTLLPLALPKMRRTRVDSWVPLRYRAENCRGERHARLFRDAVAYLPEQVQRGLARFQ